MKIEGIDDIYCINLERRIDRKKQVQEEFSKIGLDFKFFNGIDGHLLKVNSKIKPGHVGCVMSHLNLYKHLKNHEGNTFMITEDDVVFKEGFIDLYLKWINQVPDDWNLLYFGGNHNSLNLDMVSENVHRLKNTYTTHCYIVKKNSLDLLIDEFDNDDIFNSEVDVHLSNVQKKIPCYGFTPSLAWQREGFSDIEMRDVDYNFLKK